MIHSELGVAGAAPGGGGRPPRPLLREGDSYVDHFSGVCGYCEEEWWEGVR